MASRGYKTSPEVADLIRTVEATEGWSTRQGPRVVQFLHPDGQQVIRLDNTADATDFKRAQAALSRFGIGGSDTIVTTETVTIQRDLGFVDPYPTWSVFEKAKKVWKQMRDYAVATSKPMALVDGAEFYVVDDKPLAYFINRVLPKIRDQYEGPGGTREVYDYLRATGNAVREKDEDQNSIWACRSTWSDQEVTVVFRNPRRAMSDYDTALTKRENRLREEEVSQRLRAPQDDLTVIKKEPTPPKPEEPTVPVDTDALTEEEQRLLDEARARRALLTCPECKEAGEAFVAGNPQGLAAHRKAAHGVEAKGTSHQSVVPKIKPSDPKAEVGAAFALLAEALDAFAAKTDPNEALVAEVAALGTQMAEMQQEMAFLRADAEVQRGRAERAEEIIGCIRLAFDTQPMAQAAASTIDLLPPNKDVK